MWDVTENTYMHVEINILVTVVLCYPNYMKAKLTGSKHADRWQQSKLRIAPKIHCSEVKKNIVRSITICFVT